MIGRGVQQQWLSIKGSMGIRHGPREGLDSGAAVDCGLVWPLVTFAPGPPSNGVAGIFANPVSAALRPHAVWSSGHLFILLRLSYDDYNRMQKI